MITVYIVLFCGVEIIVTDYARQLSVVVMVLACRLNFECPGVIRTMAATITLSIMQFPSLLGVQVNRSCHF